LLLSVDRQTRLRFNALTAYAVGEITGVAARIAACSRDCTPCVGRLRCLIARPDGDRAVTAVSVCLSVAMSSTLAAGGTGYKYTPSETDITDVDDDQRPGGRRRGVAV